MKKRTLIKSLALSLVLSTILGISAFAAGGENYPISWSFNSTLTGAARSFTGGVMHLKATSWSAGTGEFNSILYKKELLADTNLGIRSLPKNGTSNVYWHGIKPGKYYIYLAQAFPHANYIDGYGTMNSYGGA